MGRRAHENGVEVNGYGGDGHAHIPAKHEISAWVRRNGIA
jgi:hypothetical protein